MKTNEVISGALLREELHLKGFAGKLVSAALMRFSGVSKVNRDYPRYAAYTGSDFSAKVVEGLGVKYVVPAGQLARIPAEGGFITVSNHPFGALDALILDDIVGHRRSDFRILSSLFLPRIPALKKDFLSSGDLEDALAHLDKGRPLGMFPAVDVSTYQEGENRTAICDKRVDEDKPWSEGLIELVLKSGLPVIPIYFDGSNSEKYHSRKTRLGKNVRLFREMYSKGGETVQVRIGQPISADDIAKYDVRTLAKYLRSRTYALEVNCIECPEVFEIPDAEPIAEQEDISLICDEIDRIEDRVLYEIGDYKCLYTPSTDIPHTMRELARLREVIYRLEGEGTGNPLDTDVYDETYNHLILWNNTTREIVGAYRVGVGPELFKNGLDALYTASLLTYNEKADEILSSSLELGRSIVAPQYQKDVLPLKLLLAGLAVVAYKEPGVHYCIGTVSISGRLPDFLKSVIIYFLLKTASFPGEKFATPTHPFKFDFLRVNPDELLSAYLDTYDNIDKIDRLVSIITDSKFRVPVLIRKYLKSSAKLIDFNVDPLFNNCVDGLILLRLEHFPTDGIEALVRFMPEERREAVLSIFRTKEE